MTRRRLSWPLIAHLAHGGRLLLTPAHRPRTACLNLLAEIISAGAAPVLIAGAKRREAWRLVGRRRASSGESPAGIAATSNRYQYLARRAAHYRACR